MKLLCAMLSIWCLVAGIVNGGSLLRHWDRACLPALAGEIALIGTGISFWRELKRL